MMDHEDEDEELLTWGELGPGMKARIEGIYTHERATTLAPMIRDASMLASSHGGYVQATPVLAHTIVDHCEWDKHTMGTLLAYALVELARVHDGRRIITKEGA